MRSMSIYYGVAQYYGAGQLCAAIILMLVWAGQWNNNIYVGLGNCVAIILCYSGLGNEFYNIVVSLFLDK